MITLAKLRKLVSALNRDGRIVGVYRMKRAELEEAVKKAGYSIDHDKEQLRPTSAMKRKKVINLPPPKEKPKPPKKKDEKEMEDYKFDRQKIRESEAKTSKKAKRDEAKLSGDVISRWSKEVYT